MPTKRKPRLHKITGGSFSLYPILDEGFTSLETLLGVGITENEREQIQEASRLYLMFCGVYQDKVLWRENKAVLDEIKKQGGAFLKIFEGVDSSTVDMLISAGQRSQNNHVEQLLIDDHEKTVSRIKAFALGVFYDGQN
ncbi:MAG: hypothetical protein U9N63_00760 [Pseudomonadota bacterium]|nr:hypothetical protein [Pseudomonadota bacterium]